MLNLKKITTGILIATAISFAYSSAQAGSLTDTTIIKDIVNEYAQLLLKNPTAVNGKIEYSLTSKQFCADLLNEPEEVPADQALCDVLSSKLLFKQTIYNVPEDADGANGSIQMLYSGNQVLKYNYAPKEVSFEVNIPEFKAAEVEFITDLGQDASDVITIIPNSGAFKLTVSHTDVHESFVKFQMTAPMDHTVSDVRVALTDDNFFEFISKLDTRDVTLKTNLVGAIYQSPNSFLPTQIFPTANPSDPVAFNFGDFAGEYSANKDSQVITIAGLNLNNLGATVNSLAAFNFTSPNAISFTYDYANTAYASSSAVDVTLTAAQDIYSGMLLTGTHQFKHDTGGTLAVDAANYTLVSNLKNLKIKTVTDYLNSAMGLTLPAAKSVELSIADFSGGVNYASNILSLDTLKIAGVDAKVDNVSQLAVAQTGNFDGSIDLSTYAVSLSNAQDLQVSIIDTVAQMPAIYRGDYQFAYGANAAFSMISASGVLTTSTYLKDLILSAPSDVLIASGLTQFAAATPITLTADEVSGQNIYSVSGSDFSHNFNAIKLKQITLYEGASLLADLNQNTGNYTGSLAFVSATSASIVSLGACDLRATINSNFGYTALATGNYKLAHGAIGLTRTSSGNAMVYDYNLASLSAFGPYSGQLFEAALTSPAVGIYRTIDSANATNDILDGSIGAGFVHYGTGAGSDLATWSMSAPTKVSYGSGADPMAVAFDRATHLVISHDNAAALTSLGLSGFSPGGVGSVDATINANTLISFPSVTTGGLQAVITGAPYGDLFGVGGPLEGMDSQLACDVANTTGVCSVTLH